MHASTIFAILSFALAATATPTGILGGGEPTVGPTGNAKCGNSQVISCCNTKSVSNGAGHLIGIGGVLNGVLGGSCSPLRVAVCKSWHRGYVLNKTDRQIVSVDVPVSQACAGNQAACCTGDSTVSISVYYPRPNICSLTPRVSLTSNATTSMFERKLPLRICKGVLWLMGGEGLRFITKVHSRLGTTVF